MKDKDELIKKLRAIIKQVVAERSAAQEELKLVKNDLSATRRNAMRLDLEARHARDAAIINAQRYLNIVIRATREKAKAVAK